ncbi:MAG: NAD-dependent epimerase/dehydratase family protein, partial [Dehalococcoidia bacterium]|nr:NAD-dependent epimerase/dehydratase family protein [Dehalococcoidia bacterium]
MRALVTGGAGFIGSHLADALVTAGHDVVVLDNLRSGRREFVPSAAKLVVGDIRDPAILMDVVEECDVVFHLAAQSNVMGAMDDVDYSFTTNVAGTLNVLRAASTSGVRRLVFASSREAYGEPARIPVPETAPLTAKNPYGASKVAAEAYCNAWRASTGLDTVVLRFANIYGPRDTGRVIPLWLARALAGHDLELFGGDQLLDFLHVDVAVAALIAATNPAVRGPLNVG